MSNFLKNLFKKNRIEKRHGEPYLINDKTPFAITEAFRNLKVSLSVSIPRNGETKKGVSLLCCSSFPSEGKTTVSINLALMFAQSGQKSAKVVLVDTDLRAGRIAKAFGLHHAPGLSDFLSGLAGFEEVLHQSNENENLFVITRGTQTPRPYELLDSQAFTDLHEKLLETFDYVIFDSAPFRLVPDAFAIAPIVSGCCLVTRHKSSYERDIKAAVSNLQYVKANLLGMVVNDYRAERLSDYGNHRYYGYYSYGYGSSENEVQETAKTEKDSE